MNASGGCRRIGRAAGLTIAVLLAGAGCTSDGGGRGTGIGGSAATITGNIAPSTEVAVEPAAPVCPALGASAMVTVRGTDVAAPIEADCQFRLDEVPAGDVVLEFETETGATSLTLNNVPADAVVTLTDVRLREQRSEVAGIQVAPAAALPQVRVRIIADPRTGDAPLRVEFAVLTTTDIRPLVRWNFGDGSRSTEVAPSHVYRRPGDFIVHLRLFLPGGAEQDAFTVVRVLEPQVPDLAVQLSARPLSGAQPLRVQLRADLRNAVPPVRFLWDFGDGVMVEGAPAEEHVYRRPGDFFALVTVRDRTRRVAGDGVAIVVEPSLIPIEPTALSTIVSSATPTPTATPHGSNATPVESPVTPRPPASRSPVPVTALATRSARPLPVATPTRPNVFATALVTRAPATVKGATVTPSANTRPSALATRPGATATSGIPPLTPTGVRTANLATALPRASPTLTPKRDLSTGVRQIGGSWSRLRSRSP
jgi:hypothetical protein